jgi:hypothetical protein
MKYLKVSPQGFANEVTYFRIRDVEVAAVEAFFDGYADGGSGRYSEWTTDRRASAPGVALGWDDRDYIGFVGPRAI